jgi:hypothetical protein
MRLAFLNQRIAMYSKLLAIATAGVLMAAGTVWAQSTVKKTPGHMMQSPQARSTGPGASEYAPGHLKRNKTQSASKFTPTHRTTGMCTR